MHSRVDLTEQRVFSGGFADRIRLNISRNKRPWDFKDNLILNSFDPYKKELVITGDKFLRERKRREYMYLEGCFCERCGEDLSNKPWKRSGYGLCIKCNDILEGNSMFEYKSEGWVGFRERHRIGRMETIDLNELEDLFYKEVLVPTEEDFDNKE